VGAATVVAARLAFRSPAVTFHPKYISMVVPPALLVTLVVTGVRARRTGARGRRLAAGLAAHFFGRALVVALGAHCLEILVNLARGRSVVGDVPLAYGWRVYSLQLFGAVLIALGVRCARGGRRLLAGDAAATPEVLRTAGLVLAVVVPVIPISPDLGGIFGGAALLTAGLVAAGGRAPQAPAADRRRVVGPPEVRAA
jgi:hypothetical protein